MAGGAEFGMDASGAMSVMGTLNGFTAKVKTPFYINSVLRYAHARLSDFFDLWLDNKATNSPHEFMHVYEWPQHFRAYEETVGNSAYRLWAHKFTGKSSDASAGFIFLPSTRPTPVDPILLKPGPGGRVVKHGVHVFHFKATVMEYGLPVDITPKLAQYLAYVISASKGGGTDGDPLRRPNMPEEQGGDVMLSKGPVHIDSAGGGKTTHKFTTAFKEFYDSLAADHMRNDIMPRVEKELAATMKLQLEQNAKASIKSGKVATKSLGLTGGEHFAEAQREVEAALDVQANRFIAEAAVRRRELYGS
jgi:hypothetical protein